jgi:hypothetical protein
MMVATTSATASDHQNINGVIRDPKGVKLSLNIGGNSIDKF